MPTNRKGYPESPMDGGYGWVVLTGASMTTMWYGTSQLIFAIFLPELTEAFPEKSKAEIAFIGATQLGVTFFGALAAGLLMTRWSCRTVCITGLVLSSLGNCSAAFSYSYASLIITFSLMAGMGSGIAGVSAIVAPQLYFHRRRAMASGIVMAAMSVGVLTFSPCFRLMIDYFTWRGALLAAASYNMQCVVCAMLFRPITHKQNSPKHDDAVSAEDEHRTQHAIAKQIMQSARSTFEIHKLLFNSPLFKWFMVCFLLEPFSSMTFFSLFVHRAVSYGISEGAASFLPSGYGLASAVSRIVVGVLADYCPGRLVFFTGLAVILQGLIVAVSVTAKHVYILHISCAAVFGVAFGTSMSLQPVALVNLVGVELLPTAYAFLQVSRGIGTFAALPLAGFLHDVTRDYVIVFLVGSCVSVFGGILLVSSACVSETKTCETPESSPKDDVQSIQ